MIHRLMQARGCCGRWLRCAARMLAGGVPVRLHGTAYMCIWPTCALARLPSLALRAFFSLLRAELPLAIADKSGAAAAQRGGCLRVRPAARQELATPRYQLQHTMYPYTK